MWHMIDQIIRDSRQFFTEVREGKDLGPKIRTLLWLFLAMAMPYGFVMGAQGGLFKASGWYFAVASAVKVPLLFLGTLAICLPATYISNILFGPRLRLRVLITLFIATFAVMTVMLAASLPIVLFFLVGGRNYVFMKLLHVLVFTIGGLYGLYFLWRGVGIVAGEREVAETAPVKVWMVIYGFVGAQMSWMLRPFLGEPGKAFHLFRPQESNFYAHIVETLRKVAGG